ncbi:MAG: bifunctional folylpolyglutamate synthase/dihydrofolate synthase, partial [Phycisphaerae bacterium]|nr:bifunctional folylpolyglutamate synthase/dihydrofolate synthase [Phycisphaerae bacterium]
MVKKNKGARSFFETLTTVAYLHFLEKHIDVTLLEVGLGGRLDATNAANPLVSVITRIGYDHT